MEIIVKIKTVYGNEQIYPVDEKAVEFARMLGQKTLTRQDIDHIKRIGFKVNVQQDQINL